MKLTASNLVTFINQLPKNRAYTYLNQRNRGLIVITSVTLPEGPIFIKRYNPTLGESEETAGVISISTQMIWRIANAFEKEHPINIDRILGASYNTRSVLESLIAHTPQFYYCYPGRIEDMNGHTSIEHGHKHLIWLPNMPHQNGVAIETQTEVVISEIPTMEVVYDGLMLPNTLSSEITIDIARRHTQIQIALYYIGKQLGFRTWIAQNDSGIIYKNQKLIELDGMVKNLETENIIRAFDNAIQRAAFIDCIWFKNGRLMPAVMEVEHTTGITSGLDRMRKLYDVIPAIRTRYVIVAPDEDRTKVVQEANQRLFSPLDVRFFPYSAVEELYAICQRRQLRGVTEEFLDCYMESVRVN